MFCQSRTPAGSQKEDNTKIRQQNSTLVKNYGYINSYLVFLQSEKKSKHAATNIKKNIDWGASADMEMHLRSVQFVSETTLRKCNGVASYHRQTMAIPAKTSVHVEAILVGKAGHNVLDGSSQDVPIMG